MSQYLTEQEQKREPLWFGSYRPKFGDLLYDQGVKELGHERVIVRRIYGYEDTSEVTRIVTDVYERSFVRRF